MKWRVVKAELCGAHSLDLTFKDGTRKRVDLWPLLEGPVFEPLRDPKYFARVELDAIAGNRPGASGTVAARAVAQANPDGHTLLLGVAANLAIAANSLAGGYDPTRLFAPVGFIQRGPYAVITHPAHSIDTFTELLARAKKQPGRLHFGTPGVASAHHLAWELLLARTGISLVHVPFQGGPQMITETIAGRLDVGMTSPSSIVRQHADAGKLKIIATSGARRLDQLPHVATIAEQGVQGYAAYSWWGVVAPAGTPSATIARLNAALNNALQMPEIRARRSTRRYVTLQIKAIEERIVAKR